MRDTGGRHELKLYINYSDFLELNAKLPLVLMPDENMHRGNYYQVRSLYFDNYNDKALEEKINGTDNREKFRFRLYNGNSDYIRLEKKSKRNGLCFKRHTVITCNECECILAGNCEVLKENHDPLSLEFYSKLSTELLRPKSIVEYKRRAYIFPAGNVRVTLDYEIRTSFNTKTFLDTELITMPLPGRIILEIKYDNFLPEIIRGITALCGRQSTAFSKYAAARII